MRAAYDAAPYESRPFPASHIDHLAAIARFHGLSPAAVDRCRVLELGCASGGNLIPMADRFPASTFLGVDLSPVQTASGQHAIDGVGLTNVTLQARSITELGAADGEFDYIICHGVYSWVPAAVQDAVLRVCGECLAPHGVAYISYNAYPGWNARMTLRQLMLLNDDRSLAAPARIARARNYVERLGARVARGADAYTVSFQRELEFLRLVPDSVLLHEQLEDFNEPLLLSEFVRRAHAHGLAYLTDASPEKNSWANPDEPGDRPRAEVVRQEQEVDFIIGRTFRRSLLCRGGVPIDLTKRAEIAADLYVGLRGDETDPNSDADESAPGVRVFRSPEGARVGTSSPFLLAMFDELMSASPRVVHFRDLVDGIRRRLDGAALDDDVAALPTTLLRMVQVGMLGFVSAPGDLTTRVSDRPSASALARWEASQRLPVTNRLHLVENLPPIGLFLLSYLDGTRDRDQLVGEVQRALDEGRMSTPTRPDASQIAAIVDESLQRFASSALLIA
jgi:methyltransferase-like protein/2-polyprenyl-3-methyl-5-hydroxy-6-metoxy-1,4-benzoquinol methylase